MKAAEALLTPLLLQVPQPPDPDVPVGRDASENVVLYRWGTPRKFEFKPKSHIELGEALDLLDFPAGVRLAGSRSYFLKGRGAELHNAVLRFALDMMTVEKGFTALTVPVLVRESALVGTGFFPAGRDAVYAADPGTPEEKFLTGTGEVGLKVDADNRPITGTTINVIVSEIPVGAFVAAVIFGLNKFNPGFPLAVLGMPGCAAHTTPDLLVAGLAAGTTFQTPFSIPNIAALTGFQLLAQGLVLSPTIPNPFGGITSNGLDLIIGTN